MILSPLEQTLLREHFPEEEDYALALSRLEEGQPFAYVIGEWYFMNETYRLSADCLIPRPDTEHLVMWLIDHAPRGGRILDLCTGSGCIAISTLAARADLSADGVEISPGALAMAEQNAVCNRVADRLRLICADVLKGEGADRRYDVIVSNPPYIHTDVIQALSPQVQREPRRALDGGEDGLDFYRAILEHYPSYLCENGAFLFEIGYDQADDLRALASAHGMTCEIGRDYGGKDRMAILRR